MAVATPWLLRAPRVLSGVATWLGLGAIAFSAVALGAGSVYPGRAWPFRSWGPGWSSRGDGRATVGRRVGPRAHTVALDGRFPTALYLWHWPILIIAADQAGKTSLPFRQNVVWLLLALALSVVTYTLVENPIRHARVLSRGLAPIALGAVLVAATLAVSTVALTSEARNVSGRVPPVSASELAILLRRAPEVRALPADLTPSLAQAHQDWGGPPSACSPGNDQTSIPDSCIFGDTSGRHTMVIYGDSHAGMWFDALNDIAKDAQWRLVDLWKGSCPVDSLPYKVPPGWGKPGTPWLACEQWQQWALSRINTLKPNLLILTQEGRLNQVSKPFTFQQWEQGLATTFHRIHIPKSRVVVLGNIPFLPDSPPECLARHSSNIQACSGPLDTYLTGYNQVEEQEAHSVGARYINVVPWFCSTVCTGVVGHYEVYFDEAHVGATYTYVLEDVLKNALRI